MVSQSDCIPSAPASGTIPAKSRGGYFRFVHHFSSICARCDTWDAGFRIAHERKRPWRSGL